MTDSEINLLATVAWKENRRGGLPGMTSIINVVQNRVAKHGKSIAAVITAPWQFTSMSVETDPEYTVDPTKSTGLDHAMWIVAAQLAQGASAGTLFDTTYSATLYYAPGGIKTTKTITLPTGAVVPFPQTWNPAVVQYTVTIAGQHFFTEV